MGEVGVLETILLERRVGGDFYQLFNLGATSNLLSHLMNVWLYIINIIIILKIITLSYNLGEGNIRCNRLITNMGEVFSLCEISFF